MSDFLFTPATGEAHRLAEIFQGSLPESADVRRLDGSWGSLAVALGSHDPPLLHHDDAGVVVLAGYPLLRRGPSRVRIETADDMAELAARARAVEPDWRELLDGPFALLVIDAGAPGATVVTDSMSFVPVFASRGAVRVIGTHPDAVARAAGCADDIDAVSLVDFLSNESIAHPFTAYSDVRVLEPASVVRVSAELVSSFYWMPHEAPAPASLTAAAEELREILRDEVEVMTRDCDSAALLFSAGEDARAVLGAVSQPSILTAVTFAERDNREVRIARRAAHAHGARFSYGARARDHYVSNIDVLARLAGSQHRFIDVHAYGFHRSLGLARLPAVLGGFSADTLLKGEYVGRRPEHPRVLPGIRRDLLAEVAARRSAHLDRVRDLRPDSAGEWAAMWPAQVRKATGNIQGNRRLMRIYEPYMSNAVVDLAARAPQAWKRDRALFHAAVKPLLRPSWNVPHVRSRYPWFGPLPNVFLGAALNVSRGLGDRLRGLRDRQGGWTSAGDMIRTAAYARLERGTGAPGVASLLFDLPESAEVQVRRWPPRSQLLFRQAERLFAS